MTKHEITCWLPKTLERLLEIGLVDTSDPDACWEWNRTRGVSKDHPKYSTSYGRIAGRKNPIAVHRAVVELTDGKGPMLTEQDSMHSCDNPPCVNPSHLSRGTRLDNVRDMISKDRQGGVQIMTSQERSELWKKRQ